MVCCSARLYWAMQEGLQFKVVMVILNLMLQVMLMWDPIMDHMADLADLRV